MSKPNTVGLGEYRDSDLLAELVERGVMEKVIGANGLADSTMKLIRNNLRDEQRTRLATLIKGGKT